jgi:hypothetical protein
MRLLALTVGRNEADRYLAQMLEHTASVVDAHFFMDDQSTDTTLDFATHWCETMVRPDGIPSFLEHEGRFRQFAYEQFEQRLNPEHGDWVLAIDCDEILVSDIGDHGADIRAGLNRAIALARNMNAIVMPVPECFGFDDDGTPLCRTDGFWGGIRGTRLFRWQPDGTFRDKPMGSGSEPTYATRPPRSEDSCGVSIMHFGYAIPADVKAKYARYNATQHGHNDKHIQSIPARPTLRRWDYPLTPIRTQTDG